MKNQKITTYQMAVTAVMAAVLCVLGPLTVPIGAIPISLANFVICLTAWLLGQAGRPHRRLSGGLPAAGFHRRPVH